MPRSESAVADHTPHRIEEVDWDSHTSTGKLAGIRQAQHSACLEFNERHRHHLTWTIAGLDREAESVCHAPQALSREVPQMLRRGHEPPMPTGKARVQRPEITCRYDYDSVGI